MADFDVDAWLDQASRPRDKIRACVDAAVYYEFDVAAHALEQALQQRDKEGTLNKEGVRELREQVETLRDKVADRTKELEVESRRDSEWRDLRARHAVARKEQVQRAQGGHEYPSVDDEFFPALLAACAVDPPLSVEQATKLLETVDPGQAREIRKRLWDLHDQEAVDPKRAAGIVARLTSETSRTQPQS